MVNWWNILDAFVKVVGFVLTVGLSVAVILFVHRGMSRLLGRLVGDKVVAKAFSTLALILLGLEGLTGALRYVTQEHLRYLHNGLMDLLNGMAGVVQWLVLIAVLLFVAYTFRGWRGPMQEEEEEEEEPIQA